MRPWVELQFTPADHGKKTSIEFAHYGFRDADQWRESYEWFSHARAGVPANLQKELATK